MQVLVQKHINVKRGRIKSKEKTTSLEVTPYIKYVLIYLCKIHMLDY